MKDVKIKHAIVIAAAAVFSISVSAGAATLTWDSAGTSPTAPLDGGGTWDTATSEWSNGTGDQAWSNSPGTDTAVFGSGTAAAGTVTLGSSINLAGLNFNAPLSGSYIVGNASGYQLNLATGNIHIAPNVSATITSPIAGSAGLTVSGGGTLALGGLGTTSPVAFTGDTTVNNSTLTFNNLSTSTAITLGNGTSNVFLSGANATLTSGVAQSKQFYLNANVNVSAGTNATVNFSQRTYFGTGSSATLSGAPSSTLTLNYGSIASVNRDLFYASASNFLGTLNIDAPNSSGGQLIFEALNGSYSSSTTGGFTGLPGTFNVSGTITTAVLTTGQTLTLGALSGATTGIIETPISGATTGPATWSIGSLGASTIYAGTIAGSNAISITGGSLTFSGSNTYTGNTSITGGNLTIAAGGSITSNNINVSSGASLVANGSLATTATINSAGSVLVGAGGNGSISTRTLAGLNLSGGTVTVATPFNHSSRTLLVLGSLSLTGTTDSWNGTLDLTSNDLIVQGGNLTNITNQIAQGYNGGQWNGSAGIVSSAAANDSSHLRALGAILNNNTFGTTSGSLGTFDGTNPQTNDILVKYTYYGDANLDGVVDGSDYSRIDNGYLNHLTGWANGDFNYDNVINGSDYTLIDNAFNSQGTTLASQIANSPVAVSTAQISLSANASAVPEPATLTQLEFASVALLGRRRRTGPPYACTM